MQVLWHDEGVQRKDGDKARGRQRHDRGWEADVNSIMDERRSGREKIKVHIVIDLWFGVVW
ncbi:hypothetical protein HN873_063003, partial [Arachis hypogaea]